MKTTDHVRAARNACVGDGHFWKHPESVRHSVVFSGCNKDWIQYKADTLLGGRPLHLVQRAGRQTTWKSGKVSTLRHDYWTTKSVVDDLFYDYFVREPLDVIAEIDLRDLAMWYFDDGCTIERRDYIRKDGVVRYRYMLCFGNLCNTDEKSSVFLSYMEKLFRRCEYQGTMGRVALCSSKSNENNRVWQIPVPVGQIIVAEAAKFGVPGFEHKLRTHRLTFNDHPGRE